MSRVPGMCIDAGLCIHVWIDVCMQSVYRSSEHTVQCSVHVLATCGRAQCRSANRSTLNVTAEPFEQHKDRLHISQTFVPSQRAQVFIESSTRPQLRRVAWHLIEGSFREGLVSICIRVVRSCKIGLAICNETPVLIAVQSIPLAMQAQ